MAARKRAEDAVNSSDLHAQTKSLEAALDRALDKTDAMRDVLRECWEYFDNRQDADCWEGRFVPNEEMRFVTMIEEVLGERVR